jgi:hypothetical protein
MALRLTEIVVDCRDPQVQADFWAQVLGYHRTWEDEGQVEIGPWDREPDDLADQVRRAPTAPTIIFVPVPEGKVVKNRLHLDVRPTGAQDEEVQRLMGLGAQAVDIGQGDVSWVVLADPEGNEFCVLGPLRS